MKTHHSTRLEVEGPAVPLTGKLLKEFAASLPDDATISATMRDRGSQRDPEPYLHSLNATWETP